MMEERKRLLMHESLDERLSPDLQQELESYLDDAPDEAGHYRRLKQVDRLLHTAPFERAPRHLAMTIMARLAQTVQAQEQRQASPALDEAAMQVAMQLVTVATMPLMVGTSWMLLNTMAEEEMLETVLVQVAGLYILVVDVMKVMIDEAQAVYQTDPETALALLSLMPVTLLKLVEIVLGMDDPDIAQALAEDPAD